MNFDFNKILSMFNKKKKTTKKEDFEDNDDILEELEEEATEEEILDEEDFEEEVKKDTKKENKKESKKSSFNLNSINFKDRKIQIAIAAVVVLAAASIATPYVMEYLGEQEGNEIGNISNITPAPQVRPRPVHKPNPQHIANLEKPRPVHYPGQNRQNPKPIQIKHKQQAKPINITRPQNKNIDLQQNNTVNNINNMRKNNIHIASSNLNKGVVPGEEKIKQIEQEIQQTNKNIKMIQQHLMNAKLSGKKDPIGLIDKTIMQNRNFDLYLQSQIQLMKKLITYYKQRAELQKTLQLYKMAFNSEDLGPTEGEMHRRKDENNMVKIQKALQQVVTPLQQEISTLKKELIKYKQKNENNQKRKQQDFKDFSTMAKIKLNDLNIFVKNGKYIAVVHTEFGDKIFEEGDYFNGFKILKILPNMIIFERNGQKYYYTYNQTLNQKYEAAQIALPNKLSKSEVKNNNKKKDNVKEYKAVSKTELLRKLLQKRLQQLK